MGVYNRLTLQQGYTKIVLILVKRSKLTVNDNFEIIFG